MNDLDLEKEKLELAQIEKEKKEEEARKALYVFTAAYYNEIIPQREEAQRRIQEINDFLDALIGTDKGKGIVSAFLSAIKAEQENEHARENLKKFFDLEGNDQAASIKENLDALGLKVENFATIALCAADKNIDKISGYILEDMQPEEEEKEELAAVQRTSIAAAGNALADFRRGNHRSYAKLLIQGLKQCCEKFAKEASMEKALFWAGNTEDVLFLIEMNPSLAKECGVTENQMKIARQVSSMSADIKKGIQALEILSELQKVHEENTLSSKQSAKLLDDIAKMRTAGGDRAGIMKSWDEPQRVISSK